MTTNTNTLKADIAAAEAIIAKAKPIADKLAEMQAAAASIVEASRVLDVLRGQLAEAERAERLHAAAVAGWTIESIRCAEGYSGPAGRHTVTASRIVFGAYGAEPSTERHILSDLPPDLLAAVVANRDMIPAYILALDADPEQALRKHARHARRGFFSI